MTTTTFRNVLRACCVAGALMALTAARADAGASYCGAGPNADGLSKTDVTLRGQAADACYGVVLEDGDLSLATLNSIWAGQFGGGDFGFPVESNDGSVVVNGITFDFDLVGEEQTTFGTWSLSITPNGNGAPYPQTLDIVMVLENRNSGVDQWALYLFDDETFVDGNDTNDTWMVSFLNERNVTPKLDQAILYFRNGTPPAGSGAGSAQAAVPEPTSLLLLGSGLAMAARRSWRGRRF